MPPAGRSPQPAVADAASPAARAAPPRCAQPHDIPVVAINSLRDSRSPIPPRIRHPRPSFLPKPLFPAAAQLQSKLDRLMRSRPRSRPGVTHPPIMSTLGRTPRRGDGRLLFMFIAAPPLRGSGGMGAEIPEDRSRALPAPGRLLRSAAAPHRHRPQAARACETETHSLAVSRRPR